MNDSAGLRALREFTAREVRSYTRTELSNASSLRSVRTAITAGLLVRILPHTYVTSEHCESFAARAHAACSWVGGGATLGGLSALHAWRILNDPPEVIDLIAPLGTNRRCPQWIRVTTCARDLPARWWNGVPITSPSTALIEAFSRAKPRDRSELVYSALRSRAVSVADVRASLQEFPRVRNRAVLNRLLDRADRGAESHLEELAHTTVFNTQEFGDLLAQHWVRCRGRTHRLDLFHAASMTAIELDGAQFHDGASNRARDTRRDADLATLGILTLRFTYTDVVRRPQWCRDTAKRVIESRVAGAKTTRVTAQQPSR